MDNYREQNKKIAERFSEFQRMAAKRNSAVGDVLEGVVVNLLEYEHPLTTATKDEIFYLTGNNEKAVSYLSRIIKGVPIDQLLSEVRVTKSGKMRLTPDLQARIEQRRAEKEVADAAYEGAIKALEDLQDLE